MKFENIRTLENFLLEYGKDSGPPTPVSGQTSGSITAKGSVSPTSSGSSPSPSSASSPSPSKKSTQAQKPDDDDDDLMVIPATKAPMGAVVTNRDGEDQGVVVSPVGKKPNVDAVVMQDPRGEYTVADKKDKLIIRKPKAADAADKSDKLTVGDVAKAAKTAASSSFSQGQALGQRVFSSVEPNPRLNKLNEFENLSLEEQLEILSTVDKEKLDEAWSKKYKKSIDCSNPKGFSQKAHCAGRNARQAGQETSSSSVSEDDTFGRHLLRRGRYSAALKALIGVLDRKQEPRNHSVEYYAARIARSYEGVDAKELAKMYNDLVNESGSLDENLRQWFKDKWVRFGPDGKIKGDCARGSDSEGKPKCLPQSKAHALGKDGRASAARRKRREDPNPERKGAAKNVATKKESVTEQVNFPSNVVDYLKTKGYKGPYKLKQLKAWTNELEDFESIDLDNDIMVQGNNVQFDGWVVRLSDGEFLAGSEGYASPVSVKQLLRLEEKQDACYHKVKSRYKVWPSAYASGALVQCRKKGAKNWGKKSESINESILQDAVPDNSPVKVINRLLSRHFAANDIKGQMDAFFAIPDPRMIKDFRQVRASQGDKACLRPILRKYVKDMHPSLQKQINLHEAKLNEYGSLDAAKKEILQAVNSIDTAPQDAEIAKKNADLLDKIYTILNKNNVTDRISAVLPDVLKGEYGKDWVVDIAQALSNAPITYQEKAKLADNLANDKVIDASILISPGIYTVDQFTFNDPVNRKVLDHMKSFGVGKLMKGPLEHALAILSKEISIAGKGDVTVAGEPVEVKAAIGEKKGSGGGRFGETGRLPSREQMLNIINSFEQMKPLMDQALASQQSLNISNFVTLANSANLDPKTRTELGNKVFGTIFGAEAKPVIDAFNKPNADPDEVRKAYIVSNFNWYKNSDMGGEWKYLAAISLVDNSIGVVGSGEDLLRISAYKKNPAIITTDKPQEMLYQFNPKAM